MNHESRSASPVGTGLLALTDRVRGGDRIARDELQSRLQGGLAPVVRLALRRGVGFPGLVRWVHQTCAELSCDRNIPPERYASEITRRLCSALVQELPPAPARMDSATGV